MSPEAVSVLSPALARGLAARLRDAAAAADRLADFSFLESEQAPPRAVAEGDEPGLAADFVLRALHTATESTNARILASVTEAPQTITSLVAATGLPRLAVVERAHELIQVGLVARDLQEDTVVATGAGAALITHVADLGADVAAWLRTRRPE